MEVPVPGEDLRGLAFLVPVIPEGKRDVARRQPEVEKEQQGRPEQRLSDGTSRDSAEDQGDRADSPPGLRGYPGVLLPQRRIGWRVHRVVPLACYSSLSWRGLARDTGSAALLRCHPRLEVEGYCCESSDGGNELIKRGEPHTIAGNSTRSQLSSRGAEAA